MQRRSVEAIVRALNDAGVRYLIAGGLAVVAHGFVRLTMDIDLVLDLEEANLRRALAEFASLGYRPRAPVPLEQFADGAMRARWNAERGLKVFSLRSPEHAATEIDLFVEPPFDFARAHDRCAYFEVAPGLTAPFVGLDDLVAMKRGAGRQQDLLDIEKLEGLRTRGPEQ